MIRHDHILFYGSGGKPFRDALQLLFCQLSYSCQSHHGRGKPLPYTDFRKDATAVFARKE